jgi:hypothetical protein
VIRITSRGVARTLQFRRQDTGICNQSFQGRFEAKTEDMLHRSLSPAASPRGGASSLLRPGLGGTSAPLPVMRSQRPFVLRSQAFVPRQLSLFGPPGGGR